jgi:serine protease Do
MSKANRIWPLVGVAAAIMVSVQAHGQFLPDEQNTAEVFRKASPAVVHINAREHLHLKFEDITPKSGIGTGFFFDQEGHILTNFHVIEDSTQIEVVTNDGRRLTARLVGTAPGLDLAILSVSLPASEITPLALGDSDALQIGQKVMAVGNPLGLHNTLTVGVVSSTDRTLDFLSPQLEESVIQTDTAINPGNSGGPLLNSQGEVVGIVTALVADAQNLGFAIPSKVARRVIPDLLSMGHPYRPGLGFSGQALDHDLSEMLGIPLQEGFLVEEVVLRSPAEAAGLLAGQRQVSVGRQTYVLGGDIVTAINGRKVSTLGEVTRALVSGHPGEKVRMTVYREGRFFPIEFVLEPMH